MSADSRGTDVDFTALAPRLGENLLRQRMLKQANLWASFIHQGQGAFVVERLVPVDLVLTTALRAAGLYGRGRRNFLDLRVVENEVTWPGLPAEFEGFRLLQLSDLHLDLDPRLTPVVVEKLRGVRHDFAVITGDYRNSPSEDLTESMNQMRQIIPLLQAPALGVLGNHDFIEMVPHLEAAGLRILLNENHAVTRGGRRLWICGIDDPHFYQTHDFAAARRGIPPGEPTLLLSHSPETYEEAWRQGFSLQLSGHTHGGQFCLPGGYAVLNNGNCPRAMVAGPWRHKNLLGYTSRGTGSCGVPLRFNCPPEITVHVLRCAPER